jgi:hypothetical protein
LPDQAARDSMKMPTVRLCYWREVKHGITGILESEADQGIDPDRLEWNRNEGTVPSAKPVKSIYPYIHCRHLHTYACIYG